MNMSKYLRNSRLVKVVVLAAGVTGAALGYQRYVGSAGDGLTSDGVTDKRPMFAGFVPDIQASWTTNHTPSVAWDYNWDRREPAHLLKPSKKRDKVEEIDINNNEQVDKLKELIPKATRHLILIRHGQYHDTAKTDEEQTLTTLGREQADFTGARLKELGYDYKLLVNSTMARAVETAGIISKHLPDVRTQATDILREGAPIPPEPPVGHWRPEVHQFFRDGSRIEAAFRHYFHRADPKQTKDSYEIIVCHANVIRYFFCRVLQFPPEAWLRISLHHASITWIIIRPSGRVSVHTLGDCGHIPSTKLSTR